MYERVPLKIGFFYHEAMGENNLIYYACGVYLKQTDPCNTSFREDYPLRQTPPLTLRQTPPFRWTPPFR